MNTGWANRIVRFGTAVFLALVALPGAAFGGWSGYLRLDGVTGESSDTNHPGWMDVSTVSIANLSNNPAPPIGVPGGLSNGPLCFLKLVDKASPVLMLKCAQGTPIPSGTLELTTSNSSLIRFLRLNLSNLMIVSVSPAGIANGADDRPRESLCLMAQFASWNYTQFSASSGLAAEYRSTQWDFTAGAGLSNIHGPVFLVSGIQRSGGIELSWPATSGKQYRIYAVPSLDGPFTPINEVTATATGTMTFTQPPLGAALFFVVEEL